MNMVDKGVSVRAGSVDMTHGGGGRAMAELIADLFQRAPWLGWVGLALAAMGWAGRRRRN